MKHKRLVAGVLSLALACTILSPLQLAFAEAIESSADEVGSGSGSSSDENTRIENPNLVTSKTAVANGDDTYTITLEAYATGSKVTTEVKEDVPTDIILVLDQSGSMDEKFNTITSESFEAYLSPTTNSKYYEYFESGNLWYQVEGNAYIAVKVTKEPYGEQDVSDVPISDRTKVKDLLTYIQNETLYYKASDGNLYRVFYELKQGGYFFCYYSTSGKKYINTRGLKNNDRVNISGFYNRVLTQDYKYIYTYTDADGLSQIITTSQGNNNTLTDGTVLFKKITTSETITKLQALKNAVTAFTESVAQKAAGMDGNLGTPDDVKHRIAVVGFASESGYGDNTELLSIEGNNSDSVGIAYKSITAQNYKDVLQDMSTSNGQQMVSDAIDALAANGATQIDLGMLMAQNILTNNPVPEGEKRNQVVIVFTDGAPTTYRGFDKGVANAAISTADSIKEKRVTVYSVGVFSGADATSAGTKPSEDLDDGDWRIPAASNWFMQELSSNNGEVQTPSYYLSANNADTLTNIFQQISDQIETGGSSITLGSEAVVKDIISPYFTLPENANESDITVTSWNCSGVDLDGNYTWDNKTPLDVTATVENGQVSVTGFDFAENWVGTQKAADGAVTYHGKKLVISFKVKPKDGFLGGNDVPTNGAASGIYENNSADTALENFTQPTVNVPVKEPEFVLNSKTIYEGNPTTVSGLYTIPTDYTWQDDYVYITSSVDGVQDGETVTPTDCTNYTVTVTYTPKYNGIESNITGGGPVEVEKPGSRTAMIHVLHPVVSAAVKDVQKYYGETYTLGEGAQGTITLDWADANTAHTSIPTVEGVAPVTEDNYSLAYSVNGTTGTPVAVPKADFDVDVKVMKGSYEIQDAQITTTCTHGCASHTNGKYKVHVQTCQLTITKSGGAPDEPYVFDICKDGVKYSEVTIVGTGSKTIYELPVGSYTIQEDTGWSWRYTPAYDANEAVLSADNPTGAITCTNTKSKNYWLNGYSSVVTNVSGKPHTAG